MVTERPGAITYGPLTETPDNVDPDVVLMRVNGRQLMVLSDAIPGLRVEGKPQCHIVAMAKQDKVPAASVGCALSRARTGMTPDEMTCALPGRQPRRDRRRHQTDGGDRRRGCPLCRTGRPPFLLSPVRLERSLRAPG